MGRGRERGGDAWVRPHPLLLQSEVPLYEFFNQCVVERLVLGGWWVWCKRFGVGGLGLYRERGRKRHPTNSAHIRESLPASGLDLQAEKSFERCTLFPFCLGAGLHLGVGLTFESVWLNVWCLV